MSAIKSNERFVRWQSNLRQQVSFTNNLLLTIAVGIIGFIFSLLNNETLNLNCNNQTLIRLGLIFIIVSSSLGILANFSRIIDYRITLRKIKKELENETDLSKTKSLKKVFGIITWWLFYLQISSFFLGIIILSIGLFDLYCDKLG